MEPEMVWGLSLTFEALTTAGLVLSSASSAFEVLMLLVVELSAPTEVWTDK